ncbi:MAG: 30S ribosomal protein S1 [Chloroflexia bacterium]
MENLPGGMEQASPSMADLFRAPDDLAYPHLGDIRPGVIRDITPEGLRVELAPGLYGQVPEEDLSRLPDEDRAALQVGQQVLVYVTDVDDTTGGVELSLYLGEKERDWLRAEELMQQGQFWEGEVSGYNKGGLVVYFGHIRGFVPASQITGLRRNLSAEEKVSRLAEMVGTTLPLKVVEVDRRRRRLIFSEEQGRIARRVWEQAQALARLQRGQICRGRVRALTEYGAFVDLNGVVGLIHRSELAWFPVEHPCEIVQEGQEVDVYVLRVNRNRGRVSLSLKRTFPDPWPGVMERYELGQLVEGRIIRRTGAGAFVLLDDGLHGLIPASDLQQANWPEEELAVGRRILARLVRIDGPRRRLGLSLRRVRPAELAAWRKRQEPVAAEQPHEAKVPESVS